MYLTTLWRSTRFWAIFGRRRSTYRYRSRSCSSTSPSSATENGNGWAGLSTVRVSASTRSEEHTSELQSRQYLVCRLLLEKKKKMPQKTKFTKFIYIPDT